MPHPLRVPWTVRHRWDEFGAARPGLGVPHRGFDYHVPVGTPIYGTGPGGVVKQNSPGSGGANSFGNNITIAYPGRVTIDAHMNERSPLRVGDHVDQNTIVGHVGNSGSAAGVVWNGLGQDHHELRVGGILTDPIAYYGTQTAGLPTLPFNDPLLEDDMPYLFYNPSPQHPTRRAYYVPGEPLKVITEAQAVIFAGIFKQFKRVSSTTPDADVTTEVNDTMWDLLESIEGRDEVSGDIDEQALADFITNQLAPEFAKLGANIDDQPTTFTVTPT